MSDDTPTQRFPSPDSGDTPTQRLDTAEGELVEEKQKSRGLLIGLIIAGALLLVAIIVLIVFLVSRGSGTPQTAGDTTSATPSTTPSSSPTPSATPTPTPTPTPTQDAPPPPPADDGSVHITGYSISPKTVDCSDPSNDDKTKLSISWSSTNGTVAYFGVNTSDAESAGMGWLLPPSGSQHDFPNGYDPFTFNCSPDPVHYTITIVGNGSKQSKTITVKAQ